MKEVRTTDGNIVIVDDEDYERVVERKWSDAGSTKSLPYYATWIRKEDNFPMKAKVIRLHRFIMGVYDPKVFVDHKNGNNLDNRKENLRPCTPLENGRNVRNRPNKSGFRGVVKHKGKWRCQIESNGKYYQKGGFLTPESAHEEYKKMAKELHGEFASFELDKPTQPQPVHGVPQETPLMQKLVQVYNEVQHGCECESCQRNRQEGR